MKKYRFNKVLRLYATNWIHFPGFCCALMVLVIVEAFTSGSWEEIMPATVLIPVGLLTFGLVPLLVLYLLLFIGDNLAFGFHREEVVTKLVVEAVVVAFLEVILLEQCWFQVQLEENWIYACLSASLLITQLMRKRKIESILGLK